MLLSFLLSHGGGLLDRRTFIPEDRGTYLEVDLSTQAHPSATYTDLWAGPPLWSV